MGELLNVAELFDKVGKIGKKACIVSNAGGLGVLVSDACEKNGMEISKLPVSTFERLNKVLPFGWSRGNPIDLVGDALAERYWDVLARLDPEKWFDFFIVILTPQYMTECEKTAELLTHLKKPAVALFFGGEKIGKSVEFFKNNRIVVFDDAEKLGNALGKITA